MSSYITGLSPIAETPTPTPKLYEPYVDPSFPGQTIRRITDVPGERHHYSKDPPWSTDGSLIYVWRPPGNNLFLDGATYRPAFRQQVPSSDVRWVGPDVMLYLSRGEVGRLWPASGRREIISDFGRPLSLGPSEGRPSQDGRMVVLVDEAKKTAFAYDLVRKFAYPEFAYLEGWANSDWLSISPLGSYIVQAGDGGKWVRVWTLQGKLLPRAINMKHADMGLDPNGHEVIVGTRNTSPDDGHIFSAFLPDLSEKRLTPTGWGYGNHTSMTGLGPQEWACITSAGRQPTANEIVMVALDGSQRIRRLAKFRSPRDEYIDEAHAAMSPDGKRVIFGSNWGGADDPMMYVIETEDYGAVSPPTVDYVISQAVTRDNALDAGLFDFVGDPIVLAGDGIFARIWLNWNSDALLIGAAIADSDIHGEYPSAKPWQQDSLEVFVGDVQVIVTAVGQLWQSDGAPATARARHVGRSGYEVELTMPWQLAGGTGAIFPLQLAINDLRADGSRVTVNWSGLELNKTRPWKLVQLG